VRNRPIKLILETRSIIAIIAAYTTITASKKVKNLKVHIALYGNPSQSYGASLAV